MIQYVWLQDTCQHAFDKPREPCPKVPTRVTSRHLRLSDTRLLLQFYKGSRLDDGMLPASPSVSVSPAPLNRLVSFAIFFFPFTYYTTTIPKGTQSCSACCPVGWGFTNTDVCSNLEEGNNHGKRSWRAAQYLLDEDGNYGRQNWAALVISNQFLSFSGSVSLILLLEFFPNTVLGLSSPIHVCPQFLWYRTCPCPCIYVLNPPASSRFPLPRIRAPDITALMCLSLRHTSCRHQATKGNPHADPTDCSCLGLFPKD